MVLIMPAVGGLTLTVALVLGSCASQDAVRPEGRGGGDSASAPLGLSTAADQPKAFYVSPNGSPNGDGSIAAPWDLQTALEHPDAIEAGDTIWLRGGSYTAARYVSQLTGTAARPIIVRQYPGERATIDGGTAPQALVTSGAYTWFWGFEVMRSRGTAVLVHNSLGNRLINLVVHDAGQYAGIAQFTWGDAKQTEIHGCLVYNNGREYNADHGLYIQNDAATGTLSVTDNVVFNNWARGIQAYAKVGTMRETISGIVLEGNAAFHNGAVSSPVNHTKQIMVGGLVPAHDIVVRSNYTYWNSATPPNPDALSLNIGYLWGPENDDVVVENNYSVGGLYVGKWSSTAVHGNVVYDYNGPMVVMEAGGTHTWQMNRFYGDSTGQTWMHIPNGATDFRNWKWQTGFLNAGSYAGSGAPPNLIIVRANKYEAGRANIIVYNWEQRSTVSVDVSGILATGDRYVVQNVQDFHGASVASGTYDGTMLPLPMAGVPAPAPIDAAAYTPPPVTGPTFNVFVLMRTP